MHQTPRLVDWLYLLALTGFWGTAFLLNELALHSFTPAVIVSGRLAIAALLLLVLLRRSGLTLLKTERNWFSILIMALLGTILPFHLTVWAQQHIDSALTGILIAVTPLFVLSLAHFFMPRERFSAFRVAGFLFGFIGVLCIIGPESIRLMSDSLELWSMFAVLGAALSYAVNSIYTGCIQPGNPTARATHVTILGSVIALPTAVGDFSTITLPPTGMAVIAIIILDYCVLDWQASYTFE